MWYSCENRQKNDFGAPAVLGDGEVVSRREVQMTHIYIMVRTMRSGKGGLSEAPARGRHRAG